MAAAKTLKTLNEREYLAEILAKELKKKNIHSQIQIDENKILTSYHVIVISPDFKDMVQLKRDESVWSIIRALPKPLAVKISMLFAITEDELDGVKEALYAAG